jgi:VanZ family protein
MSATDILNKLAEKHMLNGNVDFAINLLSDTQSDLKSVFSVNSNSSLNNALKKYSIQEDMLQVGSRVRHSDGEGSIAHRIEGNEHFHPTAYFVKMDSGTCKMCGRDDIEPLEDLLGAIEGVKNTINKLTIPGSKEDERNRYSSNLHNLIKKYAQVDNMFGDDYKSDYNKLIDAYNTKVYTYEDWEAGVPYPEDLIIDWMDWHSNGMNVNKYDLKNHIIGMLDKHFERSKEPIEYSISNRYSSNLHNLIKKYAQNKDLDDYAMDGYDANDLERNWEIYRPEEKDTSPNGQKAYTLQEFEQGDEVPIELQRYIFDNSDGEMMDDNWSDYIEYELVKHFSKTDQPYVYYDPYEKMRSKALSELIKKYASKPKENEKTETSQEYEQRRYERNKKQWDDRKKRWEEWKKNQPESHKSALNILIKKYAQGEHFNSEEILDDSVDKQISEYLAQGYDAAAIEHNTGKHGNNPYEPGSEEAVLWSQGYYSFYSDIMADFPDAEEGY